MRIAAAALVLLAVVAADGMQGLVHAGPPIASARPVPAIIDPAQPILSTAEPAISHPSPSATAVAEPNGYHPPPYEGAVPATLAGAQVIGPTDALRLHGQGAVFVDVLPRTRRPPGLPPGTLWRVPAHRTIPGAIWLPYAGFDRLSQAEQQQMRQALHAATGGDTARTLVVFCRPDCWLSWNAARRAVALGYRAVHWFPEGAAGWVTAGGNLMAVVPADGAEGADLD